MVQSLDELRRRQGTPTSGARAAGARVPPHNLHAEESLLGAMLLSRDAIVEAVQLCAPEDFYKPAHGHVFEAITSLYAQGEPADPVTVADELKRAGLLEAVGGMGALVSLQTNTPATSNAHRYAAIVEEHALLRRLIAVAGEIAELGYEAPEDVGAAVDQAEAMVFDVAQRRIVDTMAPLRELLERSLDRLESLYERGEAITGVPTGYADLDERLSGLQPSNLVIVGARPAMGKCVAWDTPIADPATGSVLTVEQVHRRGRAGRPCDVLSLAADGRIGRRRPSAFVDDGVRPVYRVRTRLGREVRTTLSHPYLTPQGWRPLADVAVGSRIAVPRSLPVFGHEALPQAQVCLLGHLLGEGGLTVATPRCTTASPEVAEDLRRHAQGMGVEVVPERRTEHGVTYALVGGTANPVLDCLRHHGVLGKLPWEKEIPGAIYRLPRPQLAEFLCRLMAGDRWGPRPDATQTCAGIHYRTLSERLARGVQHLLLRFGLNARIRRRLIGRGAQRRPGFEVELTIAAEVSRFAAEIGDLGPGTPARSLVGRGPAHRAALTPTRRRKEVVPLSRAGTGGRLAAAIDEGSSPSGKHSDIYWDEVASIDYVGEEQVYDLTVPEDHNFVAGDVFVHNTSFALGMAAHAAMDAGVPVLFFSLEMSHDEITQRLLSAEARVEATRLRNGRLLESDWPKISHAIGRLGEAPIYIDDNPNLTVMDIRAKARRLKSRSGLGMVVVDYLQLMTGRSKVENRQVEVSEISRGLKILARELEVPVIALSQLNRMLENRADKRPVLADLRESGSLEQDADVVIFLYRDEVYNPDSPDRGVTDVIVSKHRNGPTGITQLAFLDHYARFANMARM